MNTYQQTVLNLIEQTIVGITGGRAAEVSLVSTFSNAGRVIAHTSTLDTLATLDFDFQPTSVSFSLNTDRAGSPKRGPASETIFHWTPGDPATDDEIARMVTAFRDAVVKRKPDFPLRSQHFLPKPVREQMASKMLAGSGPVSS